MSAYNIWRYIKLMAAASQDAERTRDADKASVLMDVAINTIRIARLKMLFILDEVHWLMENRGVGFILCGSSARKLKRGQANLLGGRA